MKTKRVSWQGVVLACGVSLLVVSLSPFLWAQAPKATPLGWQPPGMLSSYFSSGAISLGTYEGTLYCLRCQFSSDPKEQEICKIAGRHAHVLMMADGHVHPLYGVTEELDKQIHSEDRHEKKVRLSGKYYPISNAIMVSSIMVLEPMFP